MILPHSIIYSFIGQTFLPAPGHLEDPHQALFLTAVCTEVGGVKESQCQETVPVGNGILMEEVEKGLWNVNEVERGIWMVKKVRRKVERKEYQLGPNVREEWNPMVGIDSIASESCPGLWAVLDPRKRLGLPDPSSLPRSVVEGAKNQWRLPDLRGA